MKSFSGDTDPVVEEVWIGLLRQASTAKRFRMVSSLSASVIRWSRQAVREARPGLTEDDLNVEFVRLNYGEELAMGIAQRLAQQRASKAP
jgi:hypothetical protein